MATIKIDGKAYKPPRKRIANPAHADSNYTGEEPIHHGVEFKDEQARTIALMRAFNFYNYYYTGKNFKKDVIKYAKDELGFDKDKIELLNAAPDWSCLLQSGALLRMRGRGLVLRDKEYTWINNNVEDMLLKGAKRLVAHREAEDDANKAPVVTVQDRIKFKAQETVLGDLEDMLDQWIMGESPKIDVYEAMKAAILPTQAVKYIVDWAQRHLTEMKEAINKSDPQLVEAYSHLSAKRKKEFVGWFEGIITDAQRFGTNTKTVRKVRAKKPVSIEKQLSKLKYLKESPENKLVSINPSQIIGATELWTYNVKYKALTRYIAESGVGFEIKGTTITKYDQSTSETRKLRKPEVTLAEVLTSAKMKAAKAFVALTTKPSAPNGRLNEDTIILKATR
jgi:hypothetical protein